VHTTFKLESLKEKTENLAVGGRIILKWIIGTVLGMCIGFIWLRIGIGGALL
jgi:hypothetical protein